MANLCWQLFIYRLPNSPSRTRVAAWRELRRLGALPLQQSVAVVPDLGNLVAALDAIETRILSDGGVVDRFWLAELLPGQQERLQGEWTALREHEFAEIIEECETKFKREIEFEIFRNNLTSSEAEEIEDNLEKIKRWHQRVIARDWFHAPNRAACEAAIAECEQLLEDFIERVYLAEATEGPSTQLPAGLSWDDFPRAVEVDAAEDRPVTVDHGDAEHPNDGKPKTPTPNLRKRQPPSRRRAANNG